MADRQIELWINERWYDALSGHLKKQDATVEEKLDECLDALIDQLPEKVYEKVSRDIWEESRQEREAAEAARRISVLRVAQGGAADCLLAEGAASMDVLHAALRLRSYLLAKGGPSRRFAQAMSPAERITPEAFQSYAGEFRQRTGRVIAVLDIDLNQGKFSALDARYGWESYAVRDICAAAWHADRKNGLDWTRRLDIFSARLEGKEITPEHRLDIGQVSFSGEIMEMDGRLNFYVEVDFDPDYAFGTDVCSDENDDWVDVYADYDMGKGQVCGALEISLCRSDGTEKAMRYHLSPAERKTLLRKMDAFCRKQAGLPLEGYCARLQAGET